LLFTLMLLTPSRLSFGQIAIPVKIDATVGLDEPTRELISRLPREVHDQLIAALQEALPLLDKSVDKYLAQVNGILDHQINHAQCSLTGVIAEADRRLKLPLTREKGPLELFDDFEKSELGRLRESSNAAFHARVYGDVFYEATVTYCEMEFSGSAVNTRDNENKYRQLDYMWLRLRDVCGDSDAQDCLKKTRKHTQTLIDISDARDVSFAMGTEKMKEVPTPPNRGLTDSIFTPFNRGLYETSLAQLLAIADGIALAKVNREHSAAEWAFRARNTLQEVGAEISSARKALEPKLVLCSYWVSPVQVQEAVKDADFADSHLNEIGVMLQMAAKLDRANQIASFLELNVALKRVRNDIDLIKSAKAGGPYPGPSGCTVNIPQRF
jgi:hypothetical protein